VTREEFEELRKSAKTIEDNIEYHRYDQDSKVWTFTGVRVINHLGYTVKLNGAYDPRTRYIKFNFVLVGVGKKQGGAICRVEVRGKVHPGAGRTHKQCVKEGTCMRRNLPYAVQALEFDSYGIRQVWETICTRANIDHTGTFFEPPEAGRK